MNDNRTVFITDEKPTVFVVDDEPQMLTLLRVLLADAGYVTETYPSAEEFLAAYDPMRPGCLLLDIRMAGMNGLQLQEALARRNVSIPIIMISAFADVPDIVKAIQGGAVDFLKKPFTEQALLERVGAAMTIDAQRRMQERESRSKLAVLTPREREVMDRLLVGKSTKEIARELGISRTTADKHRAKVFEKLEADSIVDLVRRFPASAAESNPRC